MNVCVRKVFSFLFLSFFVSFLFLSSSSPSFFYFQFNVFFQSSLSLLLLMMKRRKKKRFNVEKLGWCWWWTLLKGKFCLKIKYYLVWTNQNEINWLKHNLFGKNSIFERFLLKIVQVTQYEIIVQDISLWDRSNNALFQDIFDSIIHFQHYFELFPAILKW